MRKFLEKIQSFERFFLVIGWLTSSQIRWIWVNGRGPGNRNIGKGNGAGPAKESQSHCFADQYSKLTNTLLVQTHMTTVKEIEEQCRRL